MNQKGGSGKTTTAVNLAAALGELGKRTLVIDLDPQASATTWLGVKDGGRGLLDALTNGGGRLDELVLQTSAQGVDLVPSSTWLVGAERALASEVGAETVFRSLLKKLPDRWDFLLVDCPPSLGLLAVSALVATSEILVPVEVSPLALGGLANLTETVDKARERLNPELEISGVLACRVDMRTNLSAEVLDRLRAHFGKRVFQTVIRENVRLRECASFGKPITTYDPRSSGSEDFRAVARELLRRTRRRRP